MGDAAAGFFMCLKCRGYGHVVNDCSEPWPYQGWGWIFSSARKTIGVPEFADINQPLCERCEDMDLLQVLHQDIPWVSFLGLSNSELLESGCVRSLGQIGSIVFRQDCSLCCCLFAMTPNPHSETQQIIIFPSWTITRLEGGISVDTPEKGLYARCLLVTLDQMSGDLPLAQSAQRGDALCVFEEDELDSDTTLSGRLIDLPRINIDMVNNWLSTCSRLHPITCVSVWSEDLKHILLIDVESRRLVRYPQEGCEYLALSYVWGPITQDSVKIEASLTDLPLTIEDAVALTLTLGKRYLWVDSVCIDQGNEAEKHEQIAKMSIIYRGAYATIIAVSGESARDGIPRMRSSSAMYPQLKCRVRGKRLVGLMPTLSQEVWMSAWGTRAWCLQEALLSRRCIYISDHQMYFECNAMQCSESLNDARSWVHRTRRDAEFLKSGHLEPSVGAGVLRSPFVGNSQVNDRLRQYTVLANLYSYRSMTDPKDALNAFSGIMQYLTEIEYSKGFFRGLPVEDLNWALMWTAKAPSDRRPDFPTWSWAGWNAALSDTTPSDITNPHCFHVYLKVWRLDSKQKYLVPILSLPCVADDNVQKGQIPSAEDPLSQFIQLESGDADFDISTVSSMDARNGLFIEGVVLHFVLDYSQPQVNERAYGKYAYFDMFIADIGCLVRIMSTDPMLDDTTQPSPETCLLLARDQNDYGMYFHLLVLNQEGLLMERKSVLTLQIPSGHPEIFSHLGIEKKKIIIT